jgi:menaquinone-specific isochorismate synthase
VTTTAPMARTRRMHRALDPLDALGHDGFAWFDGERAIVTSGCAALVEARDAATALTDLGPDAIACGALPFSHTSAGLLTIPARVVRVDGDGARITEIDGAAAALPSPLSRVPRRFSVEAAQDLADWDAAVAAALELIRAKTLRKVVLAREVHIEADTPFSVPAVLETLRRTQPGCFVYAAGGFVGASPELLVRRTGQAVMARPMAGTVARQASRQADDDAIARLRTSIKDNEEHALVVDAVVEALRADCTNIDVQPPEPVRLTTVTHLTTAITARLADGQLATALDLALALHPTPAVGGAPRAAALDAIERLEPFSRAAYAGPVGWVDGRGDGEWAVALRCAELDGPRARLLAGAGIVRGSDPDAEWAETQAKLEPMLRALVRP